MFVRNKIGPPGCTPLRDEDRMPVLKVVAGDTWTVSAEFVAADGGPATPVNSFLEFVLAENQFSPPIWTGTWMDGILPDENRPGLAHVRIPRDVTKALRRGSYMFSARVSDRTKFSFSTQLAGNFLVEYMPTSDQHSIPYRDGTSEIFGGGQASDKQQGTTPPQTTSAWVRDEDTGLFYQLVAVRDPETGEMNLAMKPDGKKLE